MAQTPRKQIEQLNSLGFIWDAINWQWEVNFSALQRFYKREGHSNVPQRHREDGVKLGQWSAYLRKYKERSLPGQIKRLSSVKFSWEPRNQQWDIHFAALKRFQKREGHCRVPTKHIEKGIKLGVWVSVQRTRAHELSLDRLKCLDSIEFTWNVFSFQWEQGFSALQSFHKREGHCKVPQKHKEDGLKLGQWISDQRKKRSQLSPKQLTRLNSLGFIWKV
jgi:hypothetical protein